MAEIRLSGVNKVYPGGTHAVHDVDLHIADGEFMIMVGPSGCAKSTILRMIAGLEVPTTGTVEIGGRVVNDVAPKDRDIAMVFQSYALYPHMTVRENMAFGLRLRRMPPSEIDQRVGDAARILGLESLLDRLPKAMSGGQRQRVAMGRAIVREPQAFLMDEPLSNLDAKLRVQMRTEIAKLHQRLQTTTVYVTHDQVEAMTLGQRICILRKGVIQQVDTPFEVYTNPANVFVGGFIGSPGMNFMNGHLVLHDGVLYLQLGERHLPVPASVTSRLLATSDLHGRGVIVGMRPEHIAMSVPGDNEALPVQVELVEAMGAEVYAYFQANVSTPDLTALSDTQASMDGFVARLSAGADARSGSEIWLRPDMNEVHLFDPHTQLTMLAPAEEADVRARQSGAAHGAARNVHDARTHVAKPPSTSTVVQPVQPVIHLHQTFVRPDADMPGRLPETDTTRISAVFEQPSPIYLEQLSPSAPMAQVGAREPQPHHPRPTFAEDFEHNDAFDLGGRHHSHPGAPAMEAPVSQPAQEHRAEPLPQPGAPVNPVIVPDSPALPRRGFAPRQIGPVVVEAAPVDDWDFVEAATLEPEYEAAPEVVVQAPETEPVLVATGAELDEAIADLEHVRHVQTPGATEFELPVTPAPADPSRNAGPLQTSSAFRDALARIRAPQPAAGIRGPQLPGVLPPPLTLAPPPTVSFRGESVRPSGNGAHPSRN